MGCLPSSQCSETGREQYVFSTDGSFMRMNWLEHDADHSLHVSSYLNISGKCKCSDSSVVMYLSVYDTEIVSLHGRFESQVRGCSICTAEGKN